jgi:hypothetical protein
MTSEEKAKPPTRLDALSHSEEDRRLRGEAIRVDIARRLRKACSHLSDEEFATLIERMVNVQLGSERRTRKTPY